MLDAMTIPRIEALTGRLIAEGEEPEAVASVMLAEAYALMTANGYRPPIAVAWSERVLRDLLLDDMHKAGMATLH